MPRSPTLEGMPEPLVELSFVKAKTHIEEIHEGGKELRFEIKGFVSEQGTKLAEDGEITPFEKIRVTEVKEL